MSLSAPHRTREHPNLDSYDIWKQDNRRHQKFILSALTEPVLYQIDCSRNTVLYRISAWDVNRLIPTSLRLVTDDPGHLRMAPVKSNVGLGVISSLIFFFYRIWMLISQLVTSLIISKTNSNGENNIDIFNIAVRVTDFTHFETG